MEQPSFMPDEAQEPTIESVVPDAGTYTPPAVLKNDQEVAGVLTMANDEVDFSQSYLPTLQAVQAGNHEPLLSDILLKEKEDNIQAARAVALAAARAYDSNKLQQAAEQERTLTQSTPNVSNNPAAALHTASARALEATVLQEASRRWKDFNRVNKALDGASHAFLARSILAKAASEQEDKATTWDKWKRFFTDFLSFGVNYMDNSLLNKHFGEKVGGSYVFNTFANGQAIKDMLMNLHPSEQQALVEAMVNDPSMNPARKADLLRKVAEMTREEYSADTFFRTLDATLVTDLFRMFTDIARRGLPGKVLKDAGGEESAGKAAANDILNRTNITGWTNEELVARALAAGRMPDEIDPAAAAGLSATVQKELRDKYNTLLDGVNSRLNSSGLSKEEIAKAAAEIRNSYLQSTDKSLYHVHFGEASVDGLKARVFLQDDTGRVFLSKEAAEKYAANAGIVDYKVVPVNTVEVLASPRAQTTFHGGAVTDKFDPAFIGTGEGGDSAGWGFYLSKQEDLAEKFARDFGGRLTKWDIPENNQFINWYKSFEEQPAEVQAALSKLLKQDAAKLSGKTGQDLYLSLRDKLGSAQKASKALRKEGVVGNYLDGSNVHGIGQQHVLFDAKDAKFEGMRTVEERVRGPKVEEEPIEIEGEVFFSRRVSATKQTASVPSARAGSGTNFDDGNPLFRKGEVEASGSVDPRLVSIAAETKKLFHIDGNLLLIDMSDIETLRRFGMGDVTDALAPLTQSQGTWMPVRYMGKLTHVITLNSRVLGGSIGDILGTLKHEMGHAFEYSVLKNESRGVKAALRSEFEKWRIAKTRNPSQQDAGEFVREFHAPTPHAASVAMDLREEPVSLAQFADANDLNWYAEFGEWWAEQFARFALTDARPVSIAEKFFHGAVQRLKNLFQTMERLFGAKAVQPNEVVKNYLNAYLQRQRTPTGNAALAEEVFDIPPQQSVVPTVLGGSGRDDTPARDVGALLRPAPAPSAPGWLIQIDRVDPYSYRAVGKFSQKDIDSMPLFGVDPKHRASEQAVEARVVGVHGEAKVKKEFTDFIMPFYKKLSRAGVQRVEALLKDGDAYSNAGGLGKEFTAMEAMARGLSHDEAAAYLATRQLRMAMYFVKNKELVQHMRAQGLKEVDFLGSAVRTAGSEMPEGMAVSQLANKGVFDYINLTTTKLNADQIRQLYADGKRIVRLARPIDIEGELRQHIIVNNEVVKMREIQTALSYRPGEYARIYSDEYFITRTVTRTVDGERVPVTEVVRTAASTREAEEFVAAVKQGINVLKNGGDEAALQNAVSRYFDTDEFRKVFAEGEFDEMTDLSYHFTRNQEEYLNGSVNEALSYGRTFYSERNEKVMGMNPNRENTLSVFESLEREITNTSRVANITQWRETMVRRWMNTFGDLIPNRTGDDVADFFSAADAHFTKPGQDTLFAQRTHRYIMRQIGLKTQEERLYEQTTRQLTEKFFVGNEAIESVGAKVRKMGVLGFIRNINFNLNLGMFNPAQLLVQANGAATALVLSPLHGAASAKTFPLLRMALMSDNPDVWKFFSKIDATLFGDSEEFVKLVKAVRQTGIVDNIRSTSLYNLEDGKLNIFGGYPQRALGGHAFFFNRGEEFARLVSFDVARREWIAANKGADWTTKEALAQILVRQDDLTQNMTRANLARFQEGALSIPMQFAQYNIKLAANVMSALLGKGEGRGFTKTEALTLMAGHIVLYGAAGNGIMSLVDEMLDDETKQTMSVDAKTYLSQGLLGGLLNQIGEWFTGEKMNVAIGSRLGAFDYYHQLGKAVFTDPKNVYDALLGPTVGTAKRMGVIKDVVKLWYVDPDLSGQDILEGLERMTTEQVAVLRNGAKAYLYTMHEGKMLDKNGVATGKLSSNEILAQALGFQPTVAVDVHNLIQSKKEHNQALDDIAALAMKVQRDIMTARLRGDHKYADEQHKLLTALWPKNAGDLQEVRTRIRDRLYPYDSEFQRLLGEYMWKGHTYEQPLVVTQPPRNTNGK